VTTTSTSTSVTRILGIDPGLRITGFGVIEKVGEKISYIASGTIKTASGKNPNRRQNKVEGEDDREELPARLKIILDGLFEVIDTYQPNQVAIEKVFVNVNPQSTLLLGQARGAAISAAVIRHLTVAEYTALQVKQAVVGNGHAQKEQVQEMVKRLLNLPATPKPDSADALACAICHAHGGQGLGKLATAGFRVRGGRLV
jgi:crossover junction endodeoxyribonuclease RuvC